ncbi:MULTISPECIES: hypothetical protein [unclassified Crossiella]|nr:MULTISPECIES: hypothetical protein [unclassified Crossiella]
MLAAADQEEFAVAAAQFHCQRPADPAAGSGDHARSIVQIHHRSL